MHNKWWVLCSDIETLATLKTLNLKIMLNIPFGCVPLTPCNPQRYKFNMIIWYRAFKAFLFFLWENPIPSLDRNVCSFDVSKIFIWGRTSNFFYQFSFLGQLKDLLGLLLQSQRNLSVPGIKHRSDPQEHYHQVSNNHLASVTL